MNEMMMKIASAIKRSKNIAIYSHINTDGDAVGSTIALRDACIQLGKNVDMFIGQPLPTYLSFLVGTEALNIPLQSEYDLLITLDCNDENRMVSNKNE
ncbi:MAG: DHH family phosphoesterase, partial [Clostridia bacterium]